MLCLRDYLREFPVCSAREVDRCNVAPLRNGKHCAWWPRNNSKVNRGSCSEAAGSTKRRLHHERKCLAPGPLRLHFFLMMWPSLIKSWPPLGFTDYPRAISKSSFSLRYCPRTRSHLSDWRERPVTHVLGSPCSDASLRPTCSSPNEPGGTRWHTQGAQFDKPLVACSTCKS